ncbi:hypothetical protein WA588_006251, partial [Blastocystis sp. NMH]
MGDYAFQYTKSFAMSNLTSLQSIEFGQWCFGGDYNGGGASSFSLIDLPQLQSVGLGDWAFEHVHSVVFENLPKLQSIQLDENALYGDGSDDRKTISTKPYNYN